MFEQMKWENVYDLWKTSCYHFPELLSSPVSAETVFVEYKQDGYIYGYDWLENVVAHKRKQLIKKNPIEFMLPAMQSTTARRVNQRVKKHRMLKSAQSLRLPKGACPLWRVFAGETRKAFARIKRGKGE